MLEADRIDEALEIIALLKVNDFEEFALRASDSAHAGVELTAAEQSLSAELDQLLGAGTDGEQLAKLMALREKGRLSVQEQQRLSVLLDARAAQASDRRDRVRLLLGDREPPRARGVARVERQLDAFGPGTAMAYFLLTDTRLRILIATEGGLVEHDAPIDVVHLRLDIGRLLDSVTFSALAPAMRISRSPRRACAICSEARTTSRFCISGRDSR